MDTLGIIRQMESDPALRAQLRAVLLGEEVLSLPALVADNSRQIAELRGAVAEHSRQIDRLWEAVAENSRQIAELREAVAENSRQIARLWEAVAEHSRKIDGLRTEVGRLSAIVGGTVEEDAVSVVRTVLEAKGFRLDAEPEAVEIDGEIDVMARATDPAGARLIALVEAKTRLRPADVRRFAASYPSLVARLGIADAHVGYVYGLRVYNGSVDAARESGLGVLSPDGERLAPLQGVA